MVDGYIIRDGIFPTINGSGISTTEFRYFFSPYGNSNFYTANTTLNSADFANLSNAT